MYEKKKEPGVCLLFSPWRTGAFMSENVIVHYFCFHSNPSTTEFQGLPDVHVDSGEQYGQYFIHCEDDSVDLVHLYSFLSLFPVLGSVPMASCVPDGHCAELPLPPSVLLPGLIVTACWLQ